jgi:hypothetical protein
MIKDYVLMDEWGSIVGVRDGVLFSAPASINDTEDSFEIPTEDEFLPVEVVDARSEEDGILFLNRVNETFNTTFTIENFQDAYRCAWIAKKIN